MKTLKFLSVAAMLLLILSAKTFAQDGDDKIVGKATARAEALKTQFGLSAEQYTSVYDLFVSTMEKENALFASGKTRLEIEEGKDAIHNDFYTGIKGIFTSDQFAEFNKPETKKGMEEGAKWRAVKMQKNLGLTDDQTKSITELIISTTEKQNALVKPADGDKTAYYNERIKLDDEFYAGVKAILTPEQAAKYNAYDY